MSRPVYPRYCHLENRENTEKPKQDFSNDSHDDWNTDFERMYALLCKLFVSQSPTRVPDPVTQCVGYA